MTLLYFKDDMYEYNMICAHEIVFFGLNTEHIALELLISEFKHAHSPLFHSCDNSPLHMILPVSQVREPT